MIDCNSIITKYYHSGDSDYELLMKHSMQVATLVSQLCKRLEQRGQPVDEEFAIEAAMLHDIGICQTNAPGIFCYGKEPYIRHGVLGRAMLEGMGLFRHALVCEHHTGAGITKEEILQQQLVLPHRDMLPVTIEEKVVCYADKFFSKSTPNRCKSLERARKSLEKFGGGTMARFNEMVEFFGEPDFEALPKSLF